MDACVKIALVRRTFELSMSGLQVARYEGVAASLLFHCRKLDYQGPDRSAQL